MRTCFHKRLDKISLAVADLVPYYGEGYIVTRINVPRKHRHKGVGTELLNEVCHEADNCGECLFLEVFASGGLDHDQLRTWYEKHGFRDIDGVMRRKPKVKKP